jgi:hypothetical protein
MRRAKTHGGAPVPGSAKRPDKINKFLGWSVGGKRHELAPDYPLTPFSALPLSKDEPQA